MLTTTKDNLSKHLVDDLKIQRNDMVFMHSGLVELGRLENGLDTITEAFTEVLSEGLLIVPSFTYSWCNGKIYDPWKTECPNDVGSYSKRVWKDERFVRSKDPNFAVAALKNETNRGIIDKIFDIGNSCFGERSIFDHMYQLSKERNGYILLLGGAHNDFIFRCAFIHYVEQKVGVPSRFLKRFYNPENQSEFVEQLCRYVSRYEFDSVTNGQKTEYTFPIISDYTLLGEDLLKRDFFIRKPFGYGASRMVNIRVFCDFLSEKLKENPDYCVKV